MTSRMLVQSRFSHVRCRYRGRRDYAVYDGDLILAEATSSCDAWNKAASRLIKEGRIEVDRLR